MKVLIIVLSIAFASCVTPPAKEMLVVQAVEPSQNSIDITGDWSGEIAVANQKIPLVFHFARDDEGYAATIDSPNQGTYGAQIPSVQVAGNNVELAIPEAAVTYSGTLDDAGLTITGVWEQAGSKVDLTLARGESNFASGKPQDPKPPYPYATEEVRFRNTSANIELAGTLTIPNTSGPHPALVFITGSGLQNRDEEVFGHKPFLIIADALARSGFASLRYDDRGFGASGGIELVAKSTSFDDGLDVAGAVAFLRRRIEIDPDRIGLLGHSVGGQIAAGLAARDRSIAFVVLLAAPAKPGSELAIEQSAAYLSALGSTQAQIDAAGNANRQIYQSIIDNPGNKEASAAATEIMQSLGLPQQQIDQQLPALISPWYRLFLTYDSAADIEKLEVPVLALNGTLDLQVPAATNLPLIEAALLRAPTDQFEVVALDGLNHFFQTAVTGLIEEYAIIEETFSPRALDRIIMFLETVAGG